MEPRYDVRWFDDSRDRTARRVNCFVPRGYERYVRILYPFQGEGAVAVSWRDVANKLGIERTEHPGITQMPTSALGKLGLVAMDSFSGLDPDEAALWRLLQGPLGPQEPCTFVFSSVGVSSVPAALEPREDFICGEEIVVGVGIVAEALDYSVNYVWPSDRRWVLATVIDSMGSALLACDAVTSQGIIDCDLLEAFVVSEVDDASFLFYLSSEK